jgi:transposase
MKIEDLVGAAPPPDPLPVPRYDHLFTDRERQAMQNDLLLDLADEIILIRSHLQHLFQSAAQNPSPARLIRILDLYSRGSVRLGRLILHRQNLHKQRYSDEEAVAQNEHDEQTAREEAHKQLEQLAAIRSSKKTCPNLIIENPLTISPYMRRWIRPILYPDPASSPIRGRPSVDLFAVLEGILHKLLTGIPWYHLPLNYPPYTTCHRYFRIWLHDRRLDLMLLILSARLFNKEKLEIDTFYDEFPGIDWSSIPLDDGPVEH